MYSSTIMKQIIVVRLFKHMKHIKWNTNSYSGQTFYIRTSCEGKSKITLMGDLVKLISYKVKLRISDLLTWETM